MNLEEDFNKEIKDKLDSRTFEYSEASWEKANALIQDDQKKKKRRFFFYLLSAGAILLGTIFCLQYPFGKAETIISQKYTRETITKQNAITSQENTGNSNPNDKTNNQDLGTVSTSENSTIKTKSAGSKNQKENSILNNTNSTSTIKKIDKNKFSATKNNIIKENTYEEKTNGEVAITMTAVPKKKHDDSEYKPNKDVVKDTNIDGHENGIAVVDIKSNKKDSTIQETPIEAAKATSLPKDSVLSQPSTTIAAETKKDTTKKKIDHLQIFAFAGAAFTPGYVKNIKIKESVNPSVGVFIRKTIKPNFGIGVGLFYTIYGNVVENPKVFKNTSQDFGYKNETTEIKQSRLHYLKLPIMLDYNKGKNNFSIGAQFMYLVTSSSRVTTYKESYGLRADNSSKKVYGYTNGFLSYDISVIVGYRRQITNKISVQLLIDFGFMDVKNNTYFNSTTFDRNKSLQLNLGYKLFSK